MGSVFNMLTKMVEKVGKTYKVVLNVGHSEKQGGAQSPIGTSEWSFNKRLADLIQQFKTAGIEFIPVTQDDKRTLSQLPNYINSLNPVLVISLHANAFNKQASGSEILFTDRADLAEMLQKTIGEALHLADRGIKKLEDGDRGFFLINSCDAPCFILEPFFIDNEDDFAVAQRNIQVLAQKLATTIADIVFMITKRTN